MFFLDHFQMFVKLSWVIVCTFFYLHSSFNDQKLGKVNCFCFLAFFWRKEKTNYNLLFWRYIFVILFYWLKVMSQDALILIRCYHFRFYHTRNLKTSLNENRYTMVTSSQIYCNNCPTIWQIFCKSRQLKC